MQAIVTGPWPPYAFSDGTRSQHGEVAAQEKSPSHEANAGKPEVVAKAGSVTVTEVAELEELRRELERAAGGPSPLRWNADPDDVQRSVAQLVLTLVEFIRKLLERQAIRRMEAGTLTDEQTEDVGPRADDSSRRPCATSPRSSASPDDLNWTSGLGKLDVMRPA